MGDRFQPKHAVTEYALHGKCNCHIRPKMTRWTNFNLPSHLYALEPATKPELQAH
jgi:hypothetical protein